MGHWVSLSVTISILASSSVSSAQGLNSGIYVLDGGQSDDVIQAIDSGVAGISRADWPFAWRRLRKSSLPSQEIRISNIAGRFSVAEESPRPIKDTWMGGGPVKWKINDGRVFDVSARASGEDVLLTYQGVDYEKTELYRGVG